MCVVIFTIFIYLSFLFSTCKYGPAIESSNSGESSIDIIYLGIVPPKCVVILKPKEIMDINM